MLSGYELAREHLREIAEASADTVQIVEETTRPNGYLQFDVSIRFDGLERVEDGLSVRARELFLIVVHRRFPTSARASKHRTGASRASRTCNGVATSACTRVQQSGSQKKECMASSRGSTVGFVTPR